MSYKAKAENLPAESGYRGGALTAQEKPRLRYPCYANGCPMPGTIFGSTTHADGACAWHYNVMPNDVPKVTRVLLDWQCVAREVREARRVLTGDLTADAAGLQHAFDAAWERLQAAAPGWEEQLKPGTIRTGKGVDTGHRQGYGDWAKELERFLGARVVEVLSVHRRAA